MAIGRKGPTPVLFNYPIEYAIVDRDQTKKTLPGPIMDLDPATLRIPTYQRRLVWKEKQIESLIDSTSTLFGTVILASYDGNPELILIDGLQRFATTTSILYHLYPIVLSSEATHELKDQFKRLSARVKEFYPIIEHNHNVLKNHSRVGVKDSFIELDARVRKVIEGKLIYEVPEKKESAEKFTEKINNTFLKKQIAIDIYDGFDNKRELIHTFLNINSTGLILKEIDLLRSEIIQQAELLHWDENETYTFENKFTELFQGRGKKQEEVLGKNLYDAFEKNQKYVFPKWDNLQKSDVDEFLNFIDDIKEASLATNEDGKSRKFPFLYEIFECGSLPFAITVWYFYRIVIIDKEEKPDFMGGEYDTTVERHTLLRAFYRKVIDGTIGRTGNVAANLMQRKIKGFSELIKEINPENNCGNIDSEPNQGWLFQQLRVADITDSRRIFNAIRLPIRDDDESMFKPIIYGKGSADWNIDHLIPTGHHKKSEAGIIEANRLPNLAPLPAKYNREVKDTPCERKLTSDGVYSRITGLHDYSDWLVQEYPNVLNSGDLDNQKMLQPTVEQDSIGDIRIKKIAKMLKDRL
jgi:hypothetical protein